MRKNKYKNLLLSTSAIMLFVKSSTALAAQIKTTQTTVQSIPEATCIISNVTNLVFPDIDFSANPLSNIWTNPGGFDITCSNGIPYNVKLTAPGRGSNFSFLSNLKESGSFTKYLEYWLYRTNTQTTSNIASGNWTPGGSSEIGTGFPQRMHVQGEIYASHIHNAAQRNITPGAILNETVTIVVSF